MAPHPTATFNDAQCRKHFPALCTKLSKAFNRRKGVLSVAASDMQFEGVVTLQPSYYSVVYHSTPEFIEQVIQSLEDGDARSFLSPNAHLQLTHSPVQGKTSSIVNDSRLPVEVLDMLARDHEAVIVERATQALEKALRALPEAVEEVARQARSLEKENKRRAFEKTKEHLFGLTHLSKEARGRLFEIYKTLMDEDLDDTEARATALKELLELAEKSTPYSQGFDDALSSVGRGTPQMDSFFPHYGYALRSRRGM